MSRNRDLAFQPKKRRIRTVIPVKHEPLPYEHAYEVHHIKFRRNGGSDAEHNLVKLTPEEHHALHNKADHKLRQRNGRMVMARKGYASQMAKRRQAIHRYHAGEAKYRAYMSELAKKRWSKARVNGSPKKRIQNS